MTELDRQIRATLQTLVALQGAKILQVEKEAENLRREVAAAKKRDQMLWGVSPKQEAQA